MPSNNANVEERVLEMRIDHQQFVKGAEKTISVLDKLKNALSFKGHDDGFDRIQKSANNVDLSGIAKDLDAITKRFSTMGQVGMNVIKNLTDSVYDFTKNTIKGLTIEPVSQGMSKYESYIKATQTIMAATRNETVPEKLMNSRPIERIISEAGNRPVELLEINKIKKYSPGVWHVVIDARID